MFILNSLFLAPPSSHLHPAPDSSNMMPQAGPPGAPPSYPAPRPAVAQVYDECFSGNPSPLTHDGMLLPHPYNPVTTNTWMIQQPIHLWRQDADLFPTKDTCY